MHRPTAARSLCSVLAVLALAVVTTACGTAEPDRRTRAKGSPVQLVWGYKPPADGTSSSTLYAHYANFILTRNDEAYRNRLVARGAAPPLMYVRFDAVLRPLGGRPPLQNNVADRPGDVERLLAEHRSWFLRDAAGDPIVDSDLHGYAAYLMDPGNTGWQQHWISTVRARYDAEGWRGGVFLDNVELSLKKRIRVGHRPARYRTDAAYFGDVASMLEAISAKWAERDDVALIANTIESTYGDLRNPATVDRWTDGWMEEGFATSWRPGTWRTPEEWMWQLDKVTRAVEAGDKVFLFSQGARDDQARQRFALASYLLVAKTGFTFFRYVDYRAGYSHDWQYDDYTVRLGSPKGNRYRSGATAWRRDFGNGTVIVDPATHRATITVR